MRTLIKLIKKTIILIAVLSLWTSWWSLTYLSTCGTSAPNGNPTDNSSMVGINRAGNRDKQWPWPASSLGDQEEVIVGMAACGETGMNLTIVHLTSCILASVYYGLPSLHVILFTEKANVGLLDDKVTKLKTFAHNKGLNFRFEVYPSTFPAKDHDKWAYLYRPCSSQRLFMHTVLPHIKKLLYLDADTLVTGDLRKLWGKFKEMSSVQAIGLAPGEDGCDGLGYVRAAKKGRFPIYPPRGLNAGVMLMDLTKLRSDSEFGWPNATVSAFEKYERIGGDQDVINVVLHNRPDAVFVFPCSFNYRPPNCHCGSCKSAEIVNGTGSGIQILHGTGKFFTGGGPPRSIFREVYKYFSQIDLSKEDYLNDIIIPFRNQFSNFNNSSPVENCGKVNIGQLFFR